jgi:hypothetical protein
MAMIFHFEAARLRRFCRFRLSADAAAVLLMLCRRRRGYFAAAASEDAAATPRLLATAITAVDAAIYAAPTSAAALRLPRRSGAAPCRRAHAAALTPPLYAEAPLMPPASAARYADARRDVLPRRHAGDIARRRRRSRRRRCRRSRASTPKEVCASSLIRFRRTPSPCRHAAPRH